MGICRIGGLLLTLLLAGCSSPLSFASSVKANTTSDAVTPRVEHADRKILEILLSDLYEDIYSFGSAPVFDQMQAIANAEGFKLTTVLTNERYLHDFAIPLSDASFLVPFNQQPNLIYAARDFTLLHALVSHDEVTQGVLSHMNTSALEAVQQAIAKSGARTFRQSSLHLEGGNILSTECVGEPTVFVGKSTVLFNALLLDYQGAFSAEAVEARMAQMSFDEAEVTRVGLALSGIWGNRAACVADLEEFFFYETDDRAADDYSINLNEYSARTWLKTNVHSVNLAMLKPLAKEMLAKMDLATDQIAAELGVDRHHLGVVPQVLYHIDTFMRPGIAGVMFIQNKEAVFAEGAKLSALRKKDLDTTAKLVANMGCEPIPIQGLDFAVKNGKVQYDAMSANFFNGVMGTGTSTQRRFYITNTASNPALNQKFFEDMDQHGIFVHFVTHPLLQEDGAGMGCATLVRSTTIHR